MAAGEIGVFCRGKRDVHRWHCRVRIFQGVGESALVAFLRIDPQIALRKSQFTRRVAQADIETQVSGRGFERGPVRVASLSHGLGKQAPERVEYSRVTDHKWRADDGAVAHRHTD